MPSAPRTQVDYLRRGIEAARLLVEKPHRTVELAEALGVQPRMAARLLEQLREAGVEVETTTKNTERYHHIRVVPTWLLRAARVIAAG